MLTTHSHTPARVIAAALAIGALSVPAASARPIDPPVSDSVTLGHQLALRSQRAQDLRHLEAGNGATSGLYDSASQARYYASYGHPQTIHRVVPADDGTPWLTIAGSLAGVCLVIGGSAAIAGRRPRGEARTPRVAV